MHASRSLSRPSTPGTCPPPSQSRLLGPGKSGSCQQQSGCHFTYLRTRQSLQPTQTLRINNYQLIDLGFHSTLKAVIQADTQKWTSDAVVRGGQGTGSGKLATDVYTACCPRHRSRSGVQVSIDQALQTSNTPVLGSQRPAEQ